MSVELINLPNQALAIETQVSIQEIVQHGTALGQRAALPGTDAPARRAYVVASNWPVWLSGLARKQIAITEMKHAEAIIERAVVLDGEPTTEPSPITVGTAMEDMWSLDREQERGAIELYRHTVGVALGAGDDVTKSLFQKVLPDEQIRHRVFPDRLRGLIWRTPARDFAGLAGYPGESVCLVDLGPLGGQPRPETSTVALRASRRAPKTGKPARAFDKPSRAV